MGKVSFGDLITILLAEEAMLIVMPKVSVEARSAAAAVIAEEARVLCEVARSISEDARAKAEMAQGLVVAATERVAVAALEVTAAVAASRALLSRA